jgi:hypothetical protein
MLLTLPVRTLWAGYGLLWWAFDDDLPVTTHGSRRAATLNGDAPPGASPAGSHSARGQERAFEVVDSRPDAARSRPRPTGALRAGFVATLTLSTLLAGASLIFLAAGVLPVISGVLLWVITTIATATVSVLLVRRRERRLAIERLRRSQTRMGRAKARVGQITSATFQRASRCHHAVRSGLLAATPALRRIRESLSKLGSRRHGPAMGSSA